MTSRGHISHPWASTPIVYYNPKKQDQVL